MGIAARLEPEPLPHGLGGGTGPRLLVIEGELLLAQCLGQALADHGFAVSLAVASPGADVIGAGHAAGAELALLDLDTVAPLGPATALVSGLRAAGMAVVLLMTAASRADAAECLTAGACGASSKDRSVEELSRTLREIAEHGRPRDGTIRTELLEELRRRRRREHLALGPFGGLTRSEQEVLAALVDGRTTVEIARERVVSVETVRSQVKAVLRKLGVSSQLAAVALARTSGWTLGHAAPSAHDAAFHPSG